MAHNTSRAKQRRIIMGAPLWYYEAWQFDLTCRACAITRALPVRAALEAVERSETVGGALGRFRCAQCSSRPERVVIGYRSYHITLFGPGAPY